ncbi:hypothetical protein ACFE04_015441 [Oxalis oulophora]
MMTEEIFQLDDSTTESSSESEEEEQEQPVVVIDKPKTKKRRGPTKCAWLLNLRENGEKLHVRYDHLGNALGQPGRRLATYKGMCVRKHIPPTIRQWHDVPEDLKERLWIDLLSVATGIEDRREQLLSHCSGLWRGFKTTLTKIVNNRKEHCPEKLYDRPKKLFPAITQEQWVEFIRQREDPAFLEYSAKQKHCRSMMTCQPLVGRKGIGGVREELALEGNLNPTRDEVWLRSRTTKDGELVDVPTQEIAKSIECLGTQVSQGETKLGPREDVLQRALGTKLRPGRMVAVGRAGTTGSIFPTKKRSHDAETIRLRYEVELLKAKLVEKNKKEAVLEEEIDNLKRAKAKLDHNLNEVKGWWLNRPNFTIMSDETQEQRYVPQPSLHDYQPAPHAPAPQQFVQRDCLLATGFPTNYVAKGIVNAEGGEGQYIHGRPLTTDNCKVIVKMIIGQNHHVWLPYPTDEATTLSQSLGSLVAWPKDLICYDLEVTKNLPKTFCPPSPGPSKPLGNLPKTCPPSPVPFKPLGNLPKTQCPPNPIPSKPLVSLSRRLSANDFPYDGLRHTTPPEVFGEPWKLHTELKDIQIFVDMEPIDGSLMGTYCMLMQQKCKERNITHMYGFANPELVAFLHRNLEFQSDHIANALLHNHHPQKLTFIPYCQDFHWILLVLDPERRVWYYLDPVMKKHINKDARALVHMAFQKFIEQSGREAPNITKFIKAKVPSQPEGKECGYYVMRFMNYIIEQKLAALPDILIEGKEMYTHEELDEQRNEVAQFILDHF